MVALLLALLACASPAPDSGPGGGGGGDTGDGGSACPPLGAMFFDLGDTLVREADDGLYDAAPGAAELIDALVARGLPIGVVTNVPQSWERADLEALLRDPSILHPFEVVLLSSEASASKPDPRIFTEALALLSSPVEPRLAAFVTEELGHLADAAPPTEGAMAAGLLGVHLSDEAPSPLVDHSLAPDALATLATAPWLDCVEEGG
jgi:FMN phosphatase YigB (HAD superfamily)